MALQTEEESHAVVCMEIVTMARTKRHCKTANVVPAKVAAQKLAHGLPV